MMFSKQGSVSDKPIYVGFEIVRGEVRGDKSDVVIGSEQHLKRLIGAEDFHDARVKRNDVKIDELAVFIFSSRHQTFIAMFPIGENKQVEFRFAKFVVNVRAVHQKIRHSVSGFDLKGAIALMLT